MADQHIRRRRPKSKGKKGKKPDHLRGFSKRSISMAESNPHLRSPCSPVGLSAEYIEGRSFLRFTSEGEEHNGYQWKTGLNVDRLRFNMEAKCGPGGLYFCEPTDALTWIDPSKHTWVRKVRPVLDHNKEVVRLSNKWKARTVLADERASLYEYSTWWWLLAEGVPRTDTAFGLAMYLHRPVGKGDRLWKSLLSSTGGVVAAVASLRDLGVSGYHLCQILTARSHRISVSDWRACGREHRYLGLGGVSLLNVFASVCESLSRAATTIKRWGRF